MSNNWSSTAAGITRNNAPISLNFNIPENPASGDLPGLTVPDAFTARFSVQPPLIIPSDACCDLINASFPYSVPNVAEAGELPGIPNGNNRITITWNGVTGDYYIPTGLYSYLDVQYALNQIAVDNLWIQAGEILFTLVGVQSTQSIVMVLTPTASMGGAFPAGANALSFVNPSVVTGKNDSMGELLGFSVSGPSLVIPSGGTVSVSFNADTAADFANTTAYLLFCSIVRGSYFNGQAGELLYAFPLGQYATNSVATYQSAMRYPVPAQPGSHSQVSVYFTDNNGNKLPLRYFQGDISFSMVISKNKPDGSY